MYPDQKPALTEHSKRHRQQGVGLPLAIFIITVLALIVVGITQLQQGTAEMEIQDLQSTRAFYAAESGAQAALALLLPVSGSPASCTASMYEQTFTTIGLNSCSTRVHCSTQDLGGNTYYTLRSIGQCGFGTDSSRRIVEVLAQ